MCGINGLALSSRSRRRLNEDAVTRMRDVLRHRGPDDSGLFVDTRIALGHRRLSIVDLAAGHQPMGNEDGSVQIVYNGEVYNHAELRPSLEARGHRYATHSDTEAILHLFEEEGPRCVEQLRGMFAFAIWDANRRQLFLARDRLGIKPLYYVLDEDGSLHFASEIKALLEAGAVRPELNVPILPDYLANHASSGEETLFAGVKRLLPGHRLLWQDGQVRVERYWDVPVSPVQDNRADDGRADRAYVDEWMALFRTAVRLRLMADVPLGMFLSGGIDSAAIAAVMSGMVDEPIKTFSVAFHEREANELEYARLVAETYHTDHHEVTVSPDDFFAALPRLIWHEDEPLAHPSSVALYFVSRLAAEHVKVVLTGEGSDELLAGYARYRKTLLNRQLAGLYRRATWPALQSAVHRRIQQLPPTSGVRARLTRTFLCLSPELESIYFDNFAVFSRELQEALIRPDVAARIGPIDPYAGMRRHLEAADGASLLSRLLYADMKTYLHELLMKQDQMSMAASIESRVPFLDHKLVEYTAQLPDRMKLRGGTTKYILRAAMKGLLPDAILHRRKMGFPVPIGRWFRGPFRSLLHEYVLGDRARQRNLFDHSVVSRLVAEHEAGADHAERLWALLNFEIWMRTFMDAEPLRSAQAVLAVATS